MERVMKRPLELSHDFLAEVLDTNSITVDATMGNGNDTLFLAQHSQQVYAFDIQEEALKKTQQRLTEAGVSNARLILDGHEHLGQYVTRPLRAAIFNLGYLPSADKSITTQAQTTLEALEQVLSLLEVGGRVSLMIYYGHEGGEMEKDAVLAFVRQLNQKSYTVMLYQALNQVNTPPFLVMIEKVSRPQISCQTDG
ncbi:class I SAM-dependent methyltransferase [Streptococcus suis]|nr:class I SAM-dependent methyltransferase [Streptococcus suis]